MTNAPPFADGVVRGMHHAGRCPTSTGFRPARLVWLRWSTAAVSQKGCAFVKIITNQGAALAAPRLMLTFEIGSKTRAAE